MLGLKAEVDKTDDEAETKSVDEKAESVEEKAESVEEKAESVENVEEPKEVSGDSDSEDADDKKVEKDPDGEKS